MILLIFEVLLLVMELPITSILSVRFHSRWPSHNFASSPTPIMEQAPHLVPMITGYNRFVEIGSLVLSNPSQTAVDLLSHWIKSNDDVKITQFKQELLNGGTENIPVVTVLASSTSPHLVALLRARYPEEVKTELGVASLVDKAKQSASYLITEILPLYSSHGIETIAFLCLDLQQRRKSPLELYQTMYQTFVPFRFSLQNKETSLIIRCKRMVDEYTKDANEEERALLAETEKEGKLSERYKYKDN